MVEELSPREFLERRGQGKQITLLDVRENWEIERAPVPSPTVHIPMEQIAERVGELDPQAPTVVICRSGGRSMQVARFLAGRGFADVANLSGGILAWSRDIDPSIPQY
jgi:rhodanese-related sulfurtransferase